MWFLKLVLIFGTVSITLAATLEERIQDLEEELLKFSDDNEDIDKILDSLENKLESLETRQVKAETSLTVENEELALLPSKRAADARVAFYAYLNTNKCLGNNEILMFDNTRSSLQTGYTSDGIFSSPVAGVYAFAWTVATPKHTDKFSTELVVNGHVAGSLTSDSDHLNNATPSGIHPATTFVVANVSVGAHTYVRMKSHSADCHLVLSDSNVRSSFAGWLLF